jgi:5-methylcytosine-specific restriction endonuclease McrA
MMTSIPEDMSYDQKAYKKQYDLDHKDERCAENKAYYIANRKTYKEKHKAYYRKNKDAIMERRRAKALMDPNPQALKSAASAASRRWQKRNPEKARAININANKDRKARKLKQFVENVNRNVVYQMHGGMCGICKEFIAGKFHVDHVIPLAKGGLHCYANVQPAHPKCNMSKKDKIL